MSLDSLYEWPVFENLRKTDGFRELLKRVFGSNADRQVEPFPAKLLDLSADAKLHRIFEHLNEMAKAGEALQIEGSEKTPDTETGTEPTVH